MVDFFPALIVLLILGFATLFTKKIFKKSSPELSRKIIHVTLGLTVLSFPYVFESHITVIILGILSFLALFSLRKISYLKEKFGEGLFGIERKSYGEIYFIISVVSIFSLYRIMNLNVIHYLIPIATLTFADSTAALIGCKYGMNKISETYEDTKSLEGSFIFFVVAFMCSLIPLQLMTTVGRTEVLIISAFVGILSAMIEMTAHDGSDNFSLPFLTFLIVQYNFDKSADDLIYIFWIIIFLCIICAIIKGITNISKLAIAGALLYGYMTLILGSINWLYIPLLEFAFFSIFPKTNEIERKNKLNYRIIEYNIIIGMFFVYIKSITELIDICFVCFLISYCMGLCMNTYTRLHTFYKHTEKHSIIASIIKSLIVIEIPYIIFNAGNGVYRWWDWILVLLSTILAAFISKELNNKIDYSKTNINAAKANTIVIGITTGLIFIVYLILGGIGCITLT